MLQRKCWAARAVVSIGWVGVSAAATLNVLGDFATIQACIDAAVSGVDECVVAPGTYHETIDFFGKAITVRSSGGADVTTIDATGIGFPRGSVVTCGSGEGPETVLDGFTITGGIGTLDAIDEWIGGGMLIYSSSPTVTDCIFRGNTSDYGGGMWNGAGSPTVKNCTFSANTATDFGGGMRNYFSNPTVTNCTFSGNTAGGYGGGIYNFASSPTITRCAINGNSGLFGGGMYNNHSNPTMTSSTFTGNSATVFGGGMYDAGSMSLVTNCTFAGNTAADGSGMYNYRSNSTVTGSIFFDDRPDAIVNDTTSTGTVRFSDVQGGLPVGAIDGGGNIDLDPMFVRPPDPGPDAMWDGVDDDYGDLRLQAGSPCINAGDPAFVAQPGETDLEGHARGLCGQVDMGAYEFGIGDYDCDRAINLTDFAAWNACMTGPLDSAAFHSTIDIRQSTIGCETFDFDADGDVDFGDLARWQNAFNGS